jgi:hypothetical protein
MSNRRGKEQEMSRKLMSKLISAAALPAVVAAVIVGSAGGWFHGAGGVLAPEPARLNSTLYSSGASSATYVNTLHSTLGYFLSGSWTPSSLPAGYPCSTTYPVSAGTTLYKVVYASGSYRKCA